MTLEDIYDIVRDNEKKLDKLLKLLEETKNDTIKQIKNIAEDIIADDGWVNDSHTESEHAGIKAGLYALIHHLEETEDENV